MRKIEKSSLTQERLQDLFDYNAITGDLIRKCRKGSASNGSIAGNLMPQGYLRTTVDNCSYLNHRLVWLYVYGYFPENDLDHINRNKSDNRIENLREVSVSCNLRNRGNQKNNTSGVKGVSWHKMGNSWKATISINSKCVYLGLFKTFEEAVQARFAFEQCLNWTHCDSASSAQQYVENCILQQQL